jgi:hypothetical protein
MQCVTCGVALADAKAHYGSAFHTANAKRRAADLPPLTEEAFERMEHAKREQKAAALAADELVLYICDACGKRFGSEGQFSTHNGSKRHKERVRELLAQRRAAAAAAAAAAAVGGGGAPPALAGEGVAGRVAAGEQGTAGAATSMGDGVVEEEGQAEEEEEEAAGLEITSLHCPFCWAGPSASVEANLLHMRDVHSFFVPDLPYCVDPGGLIEQLHELVIDQRRCVLGCSAKQYECPEDAQRHMHDKVHCRISYDDEADFEAWEAFYDYEGYGDEATEGGEEVGTVDADGNLRLGGGRIAYSSDIAKYFKQRVALPDERDSVKTVLHQLAISYWGEAGAQEAGYAAPGAGGGAMVGGGGGGGGSGVRSIVASRLNAMAARRVGTRGNLTDAVAQQRAERRAAHFSAFFLPPCPSSTCSRCYSPPLFSCALIATSPRHTSRFVSKQAFTWA